MGLLRALSGVCMMSDQPDCRQGLDVAALLMVGLRYRAAPSTAG
jgi:hypothetical protein